MALARRRGDAGTVVVEFLGVAILVVTALCCVIQLAVVVWARGVVVNAAHEGARTAAEAGRPLGDGAARTRSVLTDGLGRAAVSFSIDAAQDGDRVVLVASGDAPGILPFLPPFRLRARAVAFDEDATIG